MENSAISQLRILKRLIAYAVKWRPSIVLTTAMGIVSSGVEVAAMASLIPLSQLAAQQKLRTESLWNRIPEALHLEPNIQFFVGAFFLLILLRTISVGTTMASIMHTFRELIAHFSSQAFDSFVRHLNFTQIQKEAIGHFITLAGDEANRAAQIVMASMRIIPVFALLLFYVVTLLYQSLEIGLGILAFFAVTSLALWEAFRLSHKLGRRQQAESRAIHTHFFDSLNGLRTVRGFNGEYYVSLRYKQMMGNYAWTCFLIDFVNLASRALPAVVVLVFSLVSAVALVDVEWLAQNSSYIILGVMLALRLMPLAGQVLELGMRLTSDLRAAENVGEMLSAVEAGRRIDSVNLPEITEKILRIDFDNVCFRYSDNTPEVLERFTISFVHGKSYAVTGPSGVGKSSLVDLLLKFYSPQSGVIRVNGFDVAGIATSSLRARVILAEQATRLFYDTVSNNVSFGRVGRPSDVEDSLNVVGMTEFLASLPAGVDTVVNYQGSNFSGGQRQRLGLARALLRASDVLIIDEGTSALDHVTKEKIVANVLARYKDKIVIFVTHDSFVMERVDEVITLQPAGAGKFELAMQPG